jgi:hypothetical protein
VRPLLTTFDQTQGCILASLCPPHTRKTTQKQSVDAGVFGLAIRNKYPNLIMAKKRSKPSTKATKDNSTSGPQIPAVPPPDDPLRRGTEFDPDREYKSREMANKRLEAIRRTKEMPKSSDESPPNESEQQRPDAKSDST